MPNHNRPIITGADETAWAGQPQQPVDTIDVAAVADGIQHLAKLKGVGIPYFDGFVAAGTGQPPAIYRKGEVIDGKPVRIDLVLE